MRSAWIIGGLMFLMIQSQAWGKKNPRKVNWATATLVNNEQSISLEEVQIRHRKKSPKVLYVGAYWHERKMFIYHIVLSIDGLLNVYGMTSKQEKRKLYEKQFLRNRTLYMQQLAVANRNRAASSLRITYRKY